MYQNRKTLLLSLSALLQQLTLGTNPNSTTTQVNLEVTAPLKTIPPENDIIFHRNISSPTKTDTTNTDLPQESVTLPNKPDNTEHYLLQQNINSPSKTNTPENDQFQETETLPTNTDTPDFFLSLGNITTLTKVDDPEKKTSLGSVPLPKVTDNPDNDISYKSISLVNKIDKTDNDLSQGNVTPPSETDNPENYLFNKTAPTTIYNLEKDQFQGSIDNPEIDLLHGNSSFSNRRQNPKQTIPFRPPSDSQIALLLNKYRGIVKNFSPRNLESFSQKENNSSRNLLSARSRGDNIEQFHIGKRGPIRHTPRPNFKSTGIARQGDDYPMADPNNGAGGPAGGPNSPNNPNANLAVHATTLNEAMGAASRFTTRKTTTYRRRRTTPSRVSFKEDCDYIAYYCLKAYDTGLVCGRTLYFIHMTFQNYCMLDYVNCMERYDIWQIAHMGECFEIKLLQDYLHYPYNDDYFLDNYYIVEDM